MNERLRDLRKNTGYTQEKFAEKIGIKRNTLANYETGRNEPIDAVIFSICREFNVNEDWLRTGQGDMFIQLDKEDEITKWLGSLIKPDDDNEFIRKFVHMLSKLDITDWETLEKMALMMLEEDKEES